MGLSWIFEILEPIILRNKNDENCDALVSSIISTVLKRNIDLTTKTCSGYFNSIDCVLISGFDKNNRRHQHAAWILYVYGLCVQAINIKPD